MILNIFVAGPRAISTLNKNVETRLHNIFSKNFTVLVGDASGIDTAVQKYFAGLNYPNVIVYTSKGLARNNVGHWRVENVDVPEHARGFDFFSAKDRAMAEKADYGLML